MDEFLRDLLKDPRVTTFFETGQKKDLRVRPVLNSGELSLKCDLDYLAIGSVPESFNFAQFENVVRLYELGELNLK